MLPEKKKPAEDPLKNAREDGDFAEEAGPKETEFGKESDAKDLTAGELDPIP